MCCVYTFSTPFRLRLRFRARNGVLENREVVVLVGSVEECGVAERSERV